MDWHPRRLLLLLLPLLGSSSSDVAVLLDKVKPALQGKGANNAELSTWNASTALCLWRGLRWATADGRPLRCDNLSEREPPEQVDAMVTSIRLPAAGIAGHLPPELGALSALESLYLAANSLSGRIPLELGNAPALTVLDLAGNALSGELPVSLWNLCEHPISSIRGGEVRLHGNALSGAIPAPAGPNTTCDGLRVLDLSRNNFSGEFPSFLADFRGLQRLDLSRNNLSGQVPPSLAARFPADAFLGNPCASGGGAVRSSRGVAAMVIGVMAACVVAASLCIGWASTTRWRNNTSTQDEAEEEGRLVVLEGGEHLTLEEVLNATGQALPDRKTSYCTVYKAKLASGGGSVELVLLREDCCRKNRRWGSEELGRARHENLVALRAFYFHQGTRLLVYDHFPHTRTLRHLLHHQSPPPPCPWPRRHAIALGVARALAYLHSSCSDCHGNLRSATVLVDDQFVPRLSEYGLHRLLPPPNKASDDGYRPPGGEVTGCAADVYAFGILLLELLMRKDPSSSDLPSLVKLAVVEEAPPLHDLLDPDIAVALSNNTYRHILKLAMGCCAPAPASRPTMPDVLRLLQDEDTRSNHRSATPTDGAGTPNAIYS